ncbi:MAG: WD40 repeat domain-containing protein [Chloroflexi bacterium]|nr:WD40 repeat domain-containing protein [Chloroflexota bacterium]
MKRLATWIGFVVLVALFSSLPVGAQGGGPYVPITSENAALVAEVARLTGHTGNISSLAFSADSTMLAVGEDDGWLHIWDTRTNEVVHAIYACYDTVSTIAFKPNNVIVAAGCQDSNVRLFSLADGMLVARHSMHDANVLSLAFSPDGNTLASSSVFGDILLWEPERGYTPDDFVTWQSSGGYVRTLAFSPNGGVLAAGTQDGLVQMFNSDTGETIHLLQGHSTYVGRVAFSANGWTLISSGRDGIIYWDVASGQMQRGLTSGYGELTGMGWNGGQVLVTTTNSSVLEMWDTGTGSVLNVFSGDALQSFEVALSPDGTMIASDGAADNAVLLLAVGSGSLVAPDGGDTGSSDEDLILDLVYENLYAMEAEDIDRYMATLDPTSPGYESTRQMLAPLFTSYDLAYELLEVEVVEIDGDWATVRVVQTTRKLSGPAFQNNELDILHTAHRYQGEWRLYGSEIEDMRYLD